MNSLEKGKSLRSLVVGVSLLAAFAVAIVRLWGLVAEFAVDLLFEDQWDVLRSEFEGRGWLTSFLWQHGPHRQGLGGVVQAILYPATDWNVRAEAWAAVVVLVLAVVMGVWLSFRVRGCLSWVDAGIPLLILSPVHWETMLLTPNIAHSILPLLLVLVLGLAWTMPLGWPRVGTVAVCAGLCLFTGFALCGAVMAFAAIGLLWIRGGKGGHRAQRTMLAVLAIAVSVTFASGYHWDPAVPGWYFPVKPVWRYLEFAALMFTSLIGWRTIDGGSLAVGFFLLGLVVALFAMTSWTFWQRRDDRRAQVIWILTGTTLTYCALTAVGRLPINVEAAFMWRYTTLMMPAVLGLGLAVTSWIPSLASRPNESVGGPPRSPLLLLMAVAWLGLCCLVWFDFTPERSAAATAESKRRWITGYRLTHDLAKANAASQFWVYFPAPESPTIKARLDFLEARRLSFFSRASHEGGDQ